MPRNAQIRPPKSAYDFYCKMIFDEQVARNKDSDVKEADILSMCQNKWNNMTDKEKQRFHDLESKDLERYQAELSTFGEGRSVQPKSAFFIFSHSQRQALQQRFPQYDEFQIAQECGKLWNQMSPAEKNVWEQKAYEGNF